MKGFFAGLVMFVSGAALANAAVVDLNSKFSQLDTNRDGVLSRAEVESQPKEIRFTNLYGQDSFGQADFNNDGVLERREFIEHETMIPVE